MSKISEGQIRELRAVINHALIYNLLPTIADELTRLYAIEEAAEAWAEIERDDDPEYLASYIAKQILKGEKP